MAFTRRDFLTRIGAAGGYSAAFFAMRGIGILPAAAETPALMQAPSDIGKGMSVAILGGGIAGLVAAYELRELGYRCTVLEARSRPGGRNWTVRGGDTVEFLDGTKQAVTWEKGNYQNFGPARLPSMHKTMLGYCKKLGVELQVEVNTTRSSFLQNDKANGGKPVVQRQAINDTRGHVSELLMKSMGTGSLDAEFSPEDRARMLDFLRVYGPLDKAGKYVGSDRAGYAIPPGAGDQKGVLSQPIDMHTLLDANFWDGMLFEEVYDWQATMFQPVGGMDHIPYAFAKSLGEIVKYNTPVSEIRKTAKGVRIGYNEGGAAKQLEADFCICALPLTQLKKIPGDFDPAHQQVINDCTYAHAYKVAWESRRFWEQDYNIYGGLEFVNQGCSPVWLPSGEFFKDSGVFVSGYTDARGAFEAMTQEQRFAESRKTIERLHPGHGHEANKPVYVNWGKIQYNEGSWIDTYEPGEERERSPVTHGAGQSGVPAKPAAVPTVTRSGYATLLEGDGPIFFAGDHVSHIVGWQEGAAESSHRAVGMINERVKARRS